MYTIQRTRYIQIALYFIEFLLQVLLLLYINGVLYCVNKYYLYLINFCECIKS